MSKLTRTFALAVIAVSHVGSASRLTAQVSPPAKQITIDRIVAERDREKALPHNFSWTPDGASLSFLRITATKPLRTGRGLAQPTNLKSEIWTVDTAGGRQTLLVTAEQISAAFGGQPRVVYGDDGQAAARRRQIQSFSCSPDGRALLLVSPASLVWFSLDTHTARTLVPEGQELGNPQISPDGRTVSFVQEHALWLIHPNEPALGTAHPFARNNKADQLAGESDWVYAHELGMDLAYWWSPDSSSIAWLATDDSAVDKYTLRSADGEERSIPYPKPGSAIPSVRLVVQHVAGGKPIEIDLGKNADQYIPRVQWLPDGKHLAVERLSRSQKVLDLLIADPVTGKSRTILTDKDVYWINLNNGLYFFKDSQRFLWQSERSGNSHLYLYDISGKQLGQVTHGEWQVTSLVGLHEAGANEQADEVYFTATEASPLERQLYRVHLDGTGLTRISHEKGTHQTILSPSGKVILDTWSDYSTPPHLMLLHTDGSTLGPLVDAASTDADAMPPIEFTTIKTHLDSEVHVSIRKPPYFDPAQKYPVILYITGGPGEQSVTNAWGGDIGLWLALMAQKGYVIFALDGRGSGGRGHLFEEPIHLRFSASEMADQRDGVQYLRSLPWVDGSRIGIAGWGYGGFLALHGMLDRPVIYKAGFAGSPITDWKHYDAVFGERYLEDPVRNQDGWLASSPTENAINLSGPLLLAHGTADETVHIEHSLMLLDELLDKGKYADILLFADRGNLFEERTTRRILFERLTEFFTKNL